MTAFFSTYVPEPVAFQLFGIKIMWYGILIGAGMLLATICACRRAPRHGITQERILDVLMFCLPIGVIGARAYYVAFNWGSYSGDFLKIVNLRLGGLAVHGGLIAGFLTCVVVCRLRKASLPSVLDTLAPCIALGQAIGRWGNYFNSEAHGGPTGLPWGIPVNGELVHPTFLYESIWCFILFFALMYIDNRRTFGGQVFLLYGMLYSIERFFVESLRTDSLMLGAFKQAQVMSAAVFCLCIVMYVLLKWLRRQRTCC